MRNYFFILLLIIISPFSYAWICEDVTDPTSIPCEIVTPVINCSVNVTPYINITRISDGLLLENQSNLSYIGSGIYNFSFNYSEGDYSLLLCDGSSSSITVGYEEGYDYYYMYIIVFALAFILLGLGYYTQNNVLKSIGGMFFCIIALALFIIGFPNFDPVLLNLISICFAGIGFYYIISPWIESNFYFGGG